MTDRLVTVKMLQGMAGERIALEPGELVEVSRAQAKLWAEHGVAEAAQRPPRLVPEPRTTTQKPPRTTRIG